MTPDWYEEALREGGPVALVTGGARGIGRAIAEALFAHGWRVVIGDLDEGEAWGAQGAAAWTKLDVTSENSVQQALDFTLERFGRLDLLVNNAGITRFGRIEELSWEDWSAVLDVNLNGVMRCTQIVGRHFLAVGGGHIVNVASIAAFRGVAQRAPYVATKAAVVGLTKTAAVEWADRGVRVNAVAPGYIETEFVRPRIESGELDLGVIERAIPMARMGQAEEVAKVVRFLASPDASYITGETIRIDGGFTADYGVNPSPPKA